MDTPTARVTLGGSVAALSGVIANDVPHPVEVKTSTATGQGSERLVFESCFFRSHVRRAVVYSSSSNPSPD